MAGQLAAFELQVVPSCTKEEFRAAIAKAVTPVYLEKDYLELQVSLLKPKYMSREKAPIILIKNQELNLQLRLILEDFIGQLFRLIKA